MKTNKLLAAGALALSMAMTPVASLLNAMPISAATINYPSAPASENHTYEVYQIFTGTYSAGDILSDVKWGQNAKVSGNDSTGSPVDTSIITTLTELKNASESDRLNAILGYVDLDTTPFAELTNANKSTTAVPGYYLIRDKANSLTNKNDEAYTYYIVQILGNEENLTITPKSGIPTVDKSVWDDKDPDDKDAGWDETADHDLNTIFQFKLTGSVTHETLERYTTYKMIFHDTLSKGVDAVNLNDLKVSVNETEIAKTNYTVSAMTDNDDGTKSFSITFSNVKDWDTGNGVNIEIVYDAKLNDDAILNDSVGESEIKNDNTVYLEYSNNPNADETGNTEEDKVFVASFKLTNTKVDADDKTLAGAGFTLSQKADNTKVAVFKKVNNSYKFQKWTTMTESEDGNKNYNPNLGTDEIVEIVTESNGDFSMEGLDAGQYVLTETTTPSGYNTCTPVDVTINASHEESEDETTGTVTIDTSSTMNNKVVNNKNGSLPETGGMGTTLIYGAGALMVAGAAVVFVTNKRTRKN